MDPLPWCFFRKCYAFSETFVLLIPILKVQIPFGSLRCFPEDRGMSIGTQSQRFSPKMQAVRSLYSSSVESKLDNIKCKINEMHHDGRTHIESYSISAVEEGAVDFTDQSTEAVDSFTTPVEPDSAIPTDVTPESPAFSTDSLDVDSDSLSKAKTSFNDLLSGTGNSINDSVDKGGNAVKNALDTLTSSITSVTKSASEAVDNVKNGVFSTFNQTGELAGNKLNNFSSGVKEATGKAAVASLDVLRGAIVAVEKSIGQGASFVVYSYGSAKDVLPAEIRDVLNASEERVLQILRPVGSAFQQVFLLVLMTSQRFPRLKGTCNKKFYFTSSKSSEIQTKYFHHFHCFPSLRLNWGNSYSFLFHSCFTALFQTVIHIFFVNRSFFRWLGSSTASCQLVQVPLHMKI